MGKLNMKAMRKSFDENQRGGDFWKPPVGVTKVFIHPPCRDDDEYEPTTGTNLIVFGAHYGLGKDGKQMCVCLDPERNPILQHPFIVALLKQKGIKLGTSCPVEKAIASGSIAAEKAASVRFGTRYLFGVTPIAHKARKSDEEWTKLTPKPSPMICGENVYNGIMDVIFENDGLTDFDSAIFANIARVGTGLTDTKYDVKTDGATAKKPFVMPPPLVKLLTKAMLPEGDCDLFKVLVNLTKSPEEIKALISGGKVATGRGISDDTEEDDDVDLEDDEDEPPKKATKPAKKAAPVDEDNDEDDDLEDDEDEPVKPAKKASVPPPAAVKKKSAPVIDEDDDEDLELDDEDDEPPKKKASAEKPVVAKKKAAPVDEDDDLELDEDDEDEVPPPKKTKVAEKPVKAKKPPADDDDDDDLDLDELDEELEKASVAPVKRGPGRPKKSV